MAVLTRNPPLARRQGDGQGLPPHGGPFQVSAPQREGPGKGFEMAAL